MPIRLLIVDDSAAVRAVLRRFFAQTPDIQIVGEAPDGAQAVEAVHALGPDVVLMDLQMPVMDGYAAIEAVMASRPTPIVVLSSRANHSQMQIGFEAVRRGALEVLPKPEDAAAWHELARTLPVTVRAVAGARVAALAPDACAPAPPPGALQADALFPSQPLRWVGIGASTGGPPALHGLLRAIPPSPPVSFLVVQHIAAGFERGLVDWLNKEVPALRVQVARAGEIPAPGSVHFAPAGAHLRLGAEGKVVLDASTPPRHGHRPSADELLLSLGEFFPHCSAGVLLSGMGADGAEGLLALRRAGGSTLVQDEASAAVFGMPRAALRRGASDIALAPAALGAALASGFGGRG